MCQKEEDESSEYRKAYKCNSYYEGMVTVVFCFFFFPKKLVIKQGHDTDFL